MAKFDAILPAVEAPEVDTPIDIDGSEDTDIDTDPTDAADESDTDTDSDSDTDDNDSGEAGDTDVSAPSEDTWSAKDGSLPKALKELIAAHPESAKKLKDIYFTNQRYNKLGKFGEVSKIKESIDLLGGADKVIELKNQLDTLGGVEGLQEMQQEIGAWKEVDQMWMGHDPQLASSLYESNPEAFAAFVPNALVQFGTANPEGYGHLMSQVMMNTLTQNGTVLNLQLMKQALAAGNTELAGQYFNKVEQSLGSIHELSQRAPQVQTRVDPQRQKFDQERQQFQQERQQIFAQEVQQKNAAWMGVKVNSEISSYLGGKKLSESAVARIEKAVKEEIWNDHLLNNQTFQKQQEGLKARGDKDGLVRLYKQYTDKLFPTVTRKIVKEFGLAPAGKKMGAKPAAKAAEASVKKAPDTGWQSISKYPKPDEVDNSKTTYEMKAADRYILKDGRRVIVK